MKNKKLIIRLIQQDLKHNQLTDGLRALGLDDGGAFSLDILPLVAEMMNVLVPSDNWEDVYIEHLNQAQSYEVTPYGENLAPLARECFNKLVSIGNA